MWSPALFALALGSDVCPRVSLLQLRATSARAGRADAPHAGPGKAGPGLGETGPGLLGETEEALAQAAGAWAGGPSLAAPGMARWLGPELGLLLRLLLGLGVLAAVLGPGPRLCRGCVLGALLCGLLQARGLALFLLYGVLLALAVQRRPRRPGLRDYAVEVWGSEHDLGGRLRDPETWGVGDGCVVGSTLCGPPGQPQAAIVVFRTVAAARQAVAARRCRALLAEPARVHWPHFAKPGPGRVQASLLLVASLAASVVVGLAAPGGPLRGAALAAGHAVVARRCVALVHRLRWTTAEQRDGWTLALVLTAQAASAAVVRPFAPTYVLIGALLEGADSGERFAQQVLHASLASWFAALHPPTVWSPLLLAACRPAPKAKCRELQAALALPLASLALAGAQCCAELPAVRESGAGGAWAIAVYFVCAHFALYLAGCLAAGDEVLLGSLETYEECVVRHKHEPTYFTANPHAAQGALLHAALGEAMPG